MRKQWIIAIYTATLLFTATACTKNADNDSVQVTAESTAVSAPAVPTATAMQSATASAVNTQAVQNQYDKIVNGVYTSQQGELQFQVPKGWEIQKNEGDTLLVPDKDESIADNIHIQIADKDENFAFYTQSTFEESFEEKFGKVTFKQFENVTIAGLPAIRMVYEIVQDQVETAEYQYMIDGRHTFIFTYTNVNDSLTEEELEKCIESIQILQ